MAPKLGLTSFEFKVDNLLPVWNDEIYAMVEKFG
jgi:hypothetical protein